MSMTQALDAFMKSSLMRELGQGVVAARPDLRDAVTVAGRSQSLLKVDTGGDHGVAVGLGIESPGGCRAWLIAGQGYDGDIRTYWSPALPQSAIVEAVLATLDHVDPTTHRVSPLTSPVRWAEPEHGPATDLADALDARGVRVTNVIGVNRLAQQRRGGQLVNIEVPAAVGHAVEIQCQWGSPTIALRAGLGWVMETPGNYRFGRLPDRWPLPDRFTVPLLDRRPIPAFGSIDALADVVVERARLSEDDYWEEHLGQVPLVSLPIRHALTTLGSWGLRGAGRYNHPDEGIRELPDAVVLSFEGEKPVGKPALLRRLGEIFGVQKPVIVVAESGYSRDAKNLAESRGLLLFTYSDRLGLLPHTTAASAVSIHPVSEDW
ncbi:hypothetical protein [Xylanimonas protaetiae]|uniref:Uncharacterized protein n=1 Tax=Xylanimonas protaetiae TaxID=2509457 RepID=A0A4P6F4T8_9MICO|nr:hypothetical protein [Xylanimonas protaetiae]QAY69743.1 hypothetical protein ET471_06555 [Xylanimonas protaetiae]